MNKREAIRLTKRINQSEGIRTQSYRHYGHGSWAIDIKDIRMGHSAVVYSPEDWAEMVKEGEFYIAPPVAEGERDDETVGQSA